MRLRFLGTGTSHGIPVLGCTCSVCRSRDPRDSRFRCSVAILGSPTIIIDVAPEFRLAALDAQIQNVDAVLISHPHADHIGGLDDLRPFTTVKPMPVYSRSDSLAEIRERFGYIFRHTQAGGGKPRLDLISAESEFCIGQHLIQPIPLWHGTLAVLGYRIGNFAYLSDCSRIPTASFSLLRNLDCLVIDSLRFKPHPTHFCHSQALQMATIIGARHTWTIHMSHDQGHQEITDYFSRESGGISIAPAWDGLEIDIND